MGTVLDIFYATVACDISKFMEKKKRKKISPQKSIEKLLATLASVP
jgi:hypothetical protein